jgi:dTDP-glucose 4,6-dehydratase
MRLLVTGGAGFIGANFVHSTVGEHSVTVLDALTYAGSRESLAPVEDDIRLIQGDIADAELVSKLVAEADAVVHFAAETHVDRSIAGPDDFVNTNCFGTNVVMDTARRLEIGRVVHIGTDEVYGSIDVGWWNEDAPLLPNSPYAAAKASAELLVRAYHRTYGLNVSSTRCSNTYGPHQFPEKIIPLFVTRLLDGGRLPLYGDGNNVRDWLYVDDHCQGVQLVVEQGLAGAAYNIGGGEELSNRELTQAILDAMGADWDRVEYVEDRRGHDRRYALDDSRLRALGYSPAYTFRQGLAETIEWYRAHQEWWRPLVSSPR